jgi:hypothetical protein
MALTDYYISKYDGADYERTFFLRDLQTRDSTGGGSALLGSIVPYQSEFPFGTNYVIPELYYPVPNIVTTAIQAIRPGVNVVARINRANSSIVTSKENHDIVNLSAGPFPSIPVTFGIDFDYSVTDKITTTFGNGTYQEYIPRQLFIDLYNSVNGNPTPAMGGQAISDQAIVDSTLYASNYTVEATSQKGFSVKLNADLAKLAALPLGGSVTVTQNTTNTISIQISGATVYLIALSRERWDSFDVS